MYEKVKSKTGRTIVVLVIILFLWIFVPLQKNAAFYGLDVENNGKANSVAMQRIIDSFGKRGGVIYIPAGTYYFEENGTQTYGSHCIKMRSNITIIGHGEDTILKPTGISEGGLDMFYFNEYIDNGIPTYLENCTFKNFVIDAEKTSCKVYISAGKGFMINLFKNCHWENVIVKNTDATGFGVDCPIGGSMKNCTAVDCGKAAKLSSYGASGFGIGYGYSDEESFVISDCKSLGNTLFGFFFEHQGRFSKEKYPVENTGTFQVKNCEAAGNYYNYGASNLFLGNVAYENCLSENAQAYGFYFEDSRDCLVTECVSKKEKIASFAVKETEKMNMINSFSEVVIENSESKSTPYGVWLDAIDSNNLMKNVKIAECKFDNHKKEILVK